MLKLGNRKNMLQGAGGRVSMAQILVTRMLTRDRIAVANLLVPMRFLLIVPCLVVSIPVPITDWKVSSPM